MNFFSGCLLRVPIRRLPDGSAAYPLPVSFLRSPQKTHRRFHSGNPDAQVVEHKGVGFTFARSAAQPLVLLSRTESQKYNHRISSESRYGHLTN